MNFEEDRVSSNKASLEMNFEEDRVSSNKNDRMMNFEEDRVSSEEERVSSFNIAEVAKAQLQHPIYGSLITLLKNKQMIRITPDERKYYETRLQAKLENLGVQDNTGLLYLRDRAGPGGRQIDRIVVPESFILDAITLCHDHVTAGHAGVHGTVQKLKGFAYWPTLRKDVESYIRSCRKCILYKSSGDAQSPYKAYPLPAAPFTRVHMDIVGPLPRSDENFTYILTIIDTFTRYLIAAPMRNKTAETTARTFIDRVICVHGSPIWCVTDQGNEFKGVFQEVANHLKITHTCTTAYHPSSNGVIERVNGTVIKILRTLVDDNAGIWASMLPHAVFAYNSGYNRSIKDSPFYMLFHRDPQMPYQTIMNEKAHSYNLDDYKNEVAIKLNRTYERCRRHLLEAQEQNERNQKRAKPKDVKAGDRVYVKTIPRKGERKKLQPIFSGPFRLVKRVGDVVFKLRNIKDNSYKVVHADRVKVIHEEKLTEADNRNVRKPYPIYQDITDNAKIDIDLPVLSDSDDDLDQTEPALANAPNPVSPHPYQLRSRGQVPDLPLVPASPLEYTLRRRE